MTPQITRAVNQARQVVEQHRSTIEYLKRVADVHPQLAGTIADIARDHEHLSTVVQVHDAAAQEMAR